MATYTIEDGYKRDRRKIKKRPLLIVVAFVCLFAAGSGIHKKSPNVSRIVAPVSKTAEAAPSTVKLTQSIAWPTYGQVSYGVEGQGVLASSNDQALPVPTASTAKIITALAVLKQKPLKLGEQGPMITITQNDIDIYQSYVRNDGSVVPIEIGEQISEYQALQAMLLPSANNIADSLAIWAFGSTEAYTNYANQMIKDFSLSKTHVADASGFSPNTNSTAHDLTALALIYIQNPVLKQIAQQPEATIPVAGVVNNYNALLNKDGILGIKVGYTDEAGRCFVVVNLRTDSKPISAVTVLGAANLQTAMADAVKVIASGDASYDNAVTNRP